MTIDQAIEELEQARRKLGGDAQLLTPQGEYVYQLDADSTDQDGRPCVSVRLFTTGQETGLVHQAWLKYEQLHKAPVPDRFRKHAVEAARGKITFILTPVDRPTARYTHDPTDSTGAVFYQGE